MDPALKVPDLRWSYQRCRQQTLANHRHHHPGLEAPAEEHCFGDTRTSHICGSSGGWGGWTIDSCFHLAKKLGYGAIVDINTPAVTVMLQRDGTVGRKPRSSPTAAGTRISLLTEYFRVEISLLTEYCVLEYFY
jgi:hypothetical protein